VRLQVAPDPFDDADLKSTDILKDFATKRGSRSSQSSDAGVAVPRLSGVTRVGAGGVAAKPLMARKSSSSTVKDPTTGKRTSISPEVVQVNERKMKELSAVQEAAEETSTPTTAPTTAAAARPPAQRRRSSATQGVVVPTRARRASKTAVPMAVRLGSGAPDTPTTDSNSVPSTDQFARRASSNVSPSGERLESAPRLLPASTRGSVGRVPAAPRQSVAFPQRAPSTDSTA
jgi:hypothetical protein